VGKDNPVSHIGLADAISHLRAELSRARLEGEGEDIRFDVGDIEVELALEFGSTREGGIGVKIFSFLDASAKVGASDKSGHKLKLKLSIDKSGDPSKGRISDEGGPTRAAAARTR
jgi:hypothetical protein